MKLVAYLPVSGLIACLVVISCGFQLFVPTLTDLGLMGLPAALIGVAFVLLAAALGIRWTASLGALKEKEALTILSISCLIAACISFAVAYIPSPMQLVVLGLVLLASLFIPKKKTFQADALAANDAFAESQNFEQNEVSVKESKGERFVGILGRNWVAFCGLLLCVTIQAGTWSDYLILSPGTGGMSLQDFLSNVFGFGLGSLAMLFAARLLKDRAIRTLYLVAPLVCVAYLVINWFFGEWIISNGFFSFLPMGFSLAVCAILHTARLSSELGKGLSPLMVVGPFIAFTVVLFLTWFAIFPLMGWAVSSVVDLTLKLIFLIAVAVQTIVLTQRQPIIATQTAERLLADICAELSDRYSLSERESEILFYLIQGRSAGYIAELHFVTTSTIKTHTQRIYKKTGVHSKQELLDLVHKR